MNPREEVLITAMQDARELIDGYVDVEDGDYGIPKPNKAMRAVQILEDAIRTAIRTRSEGVLR